MTNDMDRRLVKEYLDNAQVHIFNAYGEGFWVGRAVQHANQNALPDAWLKAQMEKRGLGTEALGVDALLKVGAA